MVNTATDRIATVTWMTSQTLFSDGISSAASVYQTVIARPRVSSTGPTTNRPSQRRSRRGDQRSRPSEPRTSRRTSRTRTCCPRRPAMHGEAAHHDRRRRAAGCRARSASSAMPAALRARAERRRPRRRPVRRVRRPAGRRARRRPRRPPAAGPDQLARVRARPRRALGAARHQRGEVRRRSASIASVNTAIAEYSARLEYSSQGLVGHRCAVVRRCAASGRSATVVGQSGVVVLGQAADGDHGTPGLGRRGATRTKTRRDGSAARRSARRARAAPRPG